MTITQIGTTTTVTASPNQATFGTAVTLSATVTQAPGTATPTGAVAFFNGTVRVGIANLTNGVASVQVSNLPVSAASITAQYGGATRSLAPRGSAYSQDIAPW